VAPDRRARDRCYDSRDRLFDCLDRHDILDAVAEDEKSRRLCRTENEGYERNCARAWVSVPYLLICLAGWCVVVVGYGREGEGIHV
jgi:Cytochrome oxidase c subunit VIb